ncbi:MAG: hypothetical protein JSV45_09295 [Chromatiales bacterium]|nr:MAG: hypothetical protein JSV45_09295 [Chromatiales bacterium]
MSDAPQVDLSQIRGDWHFHLNYLTNAINQSLVRAQKMWREVKDEVNDATIGKFVDQLGDSWARLEATGNDKDRIDITSPILNEFMDICTRSKAPCDAMEEAKGLAGASSINDNPLEQFTEAMRQTRSFNDDLVMMRDQKP